MLNRYTCTAPDRFRYSVVNRLSGCHLKSRSTNPRSRRLSSTARAMTKTSSTSRTVTHSEVRSVRPNEKTANANITTEAKRKEANPTSRSIKTETATSAPCPLVWRARSTPRAISPITCERGRLAKKRPTKVWFNRLMKGTASPCARSKYPHLYTLRAIAPKYNAKARARYR